MTACTHQYEAIRTLDDLGKPYLTHLTQFWVNDNALKGKDFKVVGVKGPEEAAADAL